MMRTLFALSAAVFVSACSLTAERPLFTSADQVGLPPLREGIWIQTNERCPERLAQRRSGRFPRDCAPMEIRRGEDDLWHAAFRLDLMSNPPADDDAPTGPFTLTIVPAIEHPADLQFAPLYVAEYAPDPASPAVTYFGIAPIGVMPATAFVVVDLGCNAILRDGPIEGVEVSYRSPTSEQPPPASEEVSPTTPLEQQAEERRDISGCRATTQAAVREAARRALIENFSSVADPTHERFLHVRPR